mmetsp:Transcript_15607/g.35850  ORF Transcript_15607/g.35850 Transcript_15607/m.35850 type:complete len:722 (+) Transcript_15607:97-2262(+)
MPQQALNRSFFEAICKTAALCGEAPFCPSQRNAGCNEVVQPRRWDSQAEVAEEIHDPWYPSPDAMPPSIPRLLHTVSQGPTDMDEEALPQGTRPNDRWLHSVLQQVSSNATTTRPVALADGRSRTRVTNPFDAAKMAAKHAGKLARVQVDLSPVKEIELDSPVASTSQVDSSVDSSEVGGGRIQWTWTDDDFAGKQADAPEDRSANAALQEAAHCKPEVFMASAADLAAGIPRQVSEGIVDCGHAKASVQVPLEIFDEFVRPPPGEVDDGVLVYRSDHDTIDPEDSSHEVSSVAEEGTVDCAPGLVSEERTDSRFEQVTSRLAPPAVGSLAATARGQLAQPNGPRGVPIFAMPLSVMKEQALDRDVDVAHDLTVPCMDAVDAIAAPLPATVERQRFLGRLKATDGQATFTPRRGRSPTRREDRGSNVTVCPAVAPGKMEPLAWLARMQRLPTVRLAQITRQRVLRAGLLRLDEALRARGNCTAASLENAAGVAAELLQFAKAAKMDAGDMRQLIAPEMSSIASLSVCDTLLIRASTFDVLEPLRSHEPVVTEFLDAFDRHLYMMLPSFMSDMDLVWEGDTLALGVKIALCVGAAEILVQGWGVGSPGSVGGGFPGQSGNLPVTMPLRPSIPDYWVLDLGTEALGLLNTKNLTLQVLAGTEDIAHACGNDSVAIVRGQKQACEELAQVGILDWEIFVVLPSRDDLESVLNRARRQVDGYSVT